MMVGWLDCLLVGLVDGFIVLECVYCCSSVSYVSCNF